MSLFRKRGTKFPEQNPAFWRRISAPLEPSKSVQQNNWFSERGRGVYFGRTRPQKPNVKKAWATLSRRCIFVSNDGFVDCDRQKKTKKAEVVPFRTASASCYLKSLKMSSNAKSRAVFMLFYMKARISASSTDFFFFFFFFSRALIYASPHL